jgi:peptide/nickel transport system permease protein
MRRQRLVGALLLLMLAAVAVLGPHAAVGSPTAQSPSHVLAPPMWPRIIDAEGRWRRPFVYPVVLQDRLERRYTVDRARVMPLRWFVDGRVVSAGGEWFPLGTDDLGRDIYSRFVIGARLSLGVAATAALLALTVGALAGGIAGVAPRLVDEGLMRLADLVVVLPAIYVIVTLRASLPLVLSTGATFWGMVLVLAAVGWPTVARGTRAVVARENAREYAEAARAAGAGMPRILLHHLLPAARSFLAVQLALLAPAFILAEATLSFAGLGFADTAGSWGVMLGHVAPMQLASAPWLLTPAAGIAVTVLALNLVAVGRRRSDGPPVRF